ncbi:MAG: GHKL domain-containing protein [Lachnospiraceae bacterium]|nr:GHKL domain-containing protein [Lachnospiraceae bacterium]
MIYIADNISNYLIYLFIIHFGFRLNPRKNKLFISASVLAMLSAGVYNAYFDTNSPIVYIFWSAVSICLFFEDRLSHLFVLSAALMYFTGIIDTFSVMLIQIVLIGGGVSGTGITWWMESAYLLSFLVYFLIYLKLFKKNDIYLCDIKFKYKFALFIQGSIFQMFYDYVFYFFDENHARYGFDAYAVFFISIAGAIYSIFLTLGLAIKNIQSDRQNRELQSFMYMQKQQYDYQLQQSAAVRRFRHDLINHMGVLRELANQKKTEEVKEYIDTIWKIQDEFDLKIHTGDGLFDVILNYYLYLAEKENIDFTVTGKLTGKTSLEMFDITTLMGNILQNALEAAVQTAVPKIRVEMIEHKKEIFIVVSNSEVKEMNIRKGFLRTSKADKSNHGFGLKNVAAAVRKYHGEYYTESIVENGQAMFKISIAIPKVISEEDKA